MLNLGHCWCYPIGQYVSQDWYLIFQVHFSSNNLINFMYIHFSVIVKKVVLEGHENCLELTLFSLLWVN